jgi:hypothetical protein
MSDEKIGQPLVTGFEKNGEIAAVEDGLDLRHFSQSFDQVTEIGNHLRGSSGEIYGFNIGVSHPLEDAVNRIAGDDFFALRTGVNMAVDACKVAEFADVELKDLGAAPFECQALIGQCPRKGSLDGRFEFLRIRHYARKSLNDGRHSLHSLANIQNQQQFPRSARGTML